MQIDETTPMPETAQTRMEVLKKMSVGTSILVPADRMANWRYPMQKAMETGERYYFSRRDKDGFRIWRGG